MRKRCCCILNPIYYSSQQIYYVSSFTFSDRCWMFICLFVCFLLSSNRERAGGALDGAQFHANYIHSIQSSVLIFIFKYTNSDRERMGCKSEAMKRQKRCEMDCWHEMCISKASVEKTNRQANKSSIRRRIHTQRQRMSE